MLRRIFNSSIGLKLVMAVTGLALFGFALGHMAGNLQIFLGAEAINSYAAFLQKQKELLWAARIGLLGAVVLHIYSAVKLTAINRAARPVSYAKPKLVEASVASTTMMISGLVVLAFIVFHILHFTTGNILPQYFGAHDAEGRHDVYAMVVRSFQIPLVSVFYIVSVGLLGFHLSHGLSSMFRSLGLASPTYRRPTELFAATFSSVIAVGMAVVPVAVLLGLVVLRN